LKPITEQYLTLVLAIAAGVLCCPAPARAQTYSQGQRYLLTLTAVEGSFGGTSNYDSGFVLAPSPLIGVFQATAANSYYDVTNTISYGVLNIAASCGIAGESAVGSGGARFMPEIGGLPMVLFDDRLVITSATLPSGAPIQVQVTCVNAGYIIQSFSPSLGYCSCDNGTTASARLQILQGSGYTHDVSASLGSFGIQSVRSFISNSISAVVNTTVGGSFNIIPQLYAEGQLNDGSGGSNGVASITANLTLVTYVNVLTPGAGYAADSGTVYPAYQPPAPALSIQAMNNGVVLSWPAISVGYSLQQNSTLGTTNWLPNTNSVGPIDGTNQVIVIPAPGHMFYRLVHP
jgi:hypothetical protein